MSLVLFIDGQIEHQIFIASMPPFPRPSGILYSWGLALVLSGLMTGGLSFIPKDTRHWWCLAGCVVNGLVLLWYLFYLFTAGL
jgi:hypothetical protein